MKNRSLAQIFALALLALPLATGCSSRSGSSGSSGSSESSRPAGLQPTLARQALQAILDAYRAGNMEEVLTHIDPGLYPDYSLFRRSLYDDRQMISQVRLEVHVNQEIANEDFVLIKTRWNRGVQNNATGAIQNATGVCTWQFTKDGRLVDLRGPRPIAFN